MTLGPLIGIFITGPVGFCLGALLGFVCALIRLGSGSFLAILLFSALCVAVVTLYLCIPDPQYRGTIIDAQVQGCESISDNWDQAMVAMASEIVKQQGPYVRIHPDWRNMIEQKQKAEKGVVLSMLVIQERKLHERKEPWNLGAIEGSPWYPVNRTEKYFARFAGDSCDKYTKDPSRKMYFPVREYSQHFPPDNVPAFLGLQVLGDVPQAYTTFRKESSGVKP
jgi:hypothetical protein